MIGDGRRQGAAHHHAVIVLAVTVATTAVVIVAVVIAREKVKVATVMVTALVEIVGARALLVDLAALPSRRPRILRRKRNGTSSSRSGLRGPTNLTMAQAPAKKG